MAKSLSNSRITSIDFLRGLVIILMALDHVRDFFHADAYLFDPTDLSNTYPALFFTRFVTHFCAPVFVFLAGTSAYFVGQKKGKKELSYWLLKRGVWLIILELTAVKFAWNFNLNYDYIVIQVIFVLGASMIFLAGFIHIPKRWMIALSLLVILGHNALDSFQPDCCTHLWTLLHVQNFITTPFSTVFSVYPLIPWVFVMPLGYYLGTLYQKDFLPKKRKTILITIGVSCLVLFLILRGFTPYGDLNSWVKYDSWEFNAMSFINVAKYPPSLLFLLIILGPSLLILAFCENWKGKLYRAILTFGRVPLFFYILHIFAIHLIALVVAVSFGYPASSMIIDIFVVLTPELKGFGLNLGWVYLIWIFVVIALYPISKWYWNYKDSHRDKTWLSYF